MKQKKQILVIILATVVLALLTIGAVLLYNASREPVEEGLKRFAIIVTFPGEEPRRLEIETTKDYLGAALSEQGLISGSETDFGLMVDTVDGLYADPAMGEYWLFTKFGQDVYTGVDLTPVADGDQFEFFLYE